MKRSSLFANRLLALINIANIIQITVITLLLTFTLGACSDDDEKSPFQEKLGSYSVSDLFEDSEEPDLYEVKITTSSLGEPSIQISNFGDFMFVPVQASFKGDSLIIPTQTFQGKSMLIALSGKGKLEGKNLKFDYSIETGDDILQHHCEAVKK